MMINQKNLDDSRNFWISQQELSSRLLEIVDAINYLDYGKHLFDMAKEQNLDGSEESIRCEMLLEAYEMRYTRDIGELRELVESLRSEVDKPQRSALTLVG